MPYTTKNAIVLSNQDREANPAHQEAAALCPCKSRPILRQPQHSLGPRVVCFGVEKTADSELRLAPVTTGCHGPACLVCLLSRWPVEVSLQTDLVTRGSCPGWKETSFHRRGLTLLGQHWQRDSWGSVLPAKPSVRLHSCRGNGAGVGLAMCRCWA